jgi:hypothetical protein
MTQHTTNTTNSTDASNSVSRDIGGAVSSILSMYKNDSAKYKGTIADNFHDAFDKYMRAIEDLQLPATKGLQLLQNMLTGEVLGFNFSINANCKTLAMPVLFSKHCSFPPRSKMLHGVNLIL